MSAPPVDADRIAGHLDDLGLRFFRSEDSIGMNFADLIDVMILPRTPVLLIRGMWTVDLDNDEDIRRAIGLTHEHNREKVPRAFVETIEGRTRVVFDTMVPTATGMTDEQLSVVLQKSLQLINSAVVEFAGHFPHLSGQGQGR